MGVRDNGLRNNFKVNAPIVTYPVVDGITVKPGDLLKFVNISGKIHVTNILDGDDYVDCIAKLGNVKSNNIPVYVLIVTKLKYKDFIFPYVILEQFTYDELRTISIKDNLDTRYATIFKHTRILPRYNYGNLTIYGARIEPHPLEMENYLSE